MNVGISADKSSSYWQESMWEESKPVG